MKSFPKFFFIQTGVEKNKFKPKLNQVLSKKVEYSYVVEDQLKKFCRLPLNLKQDVEIDLTSEYWQRDHVRLFKQYNWPELMKYLDDEMLTEDYVADFYRGYHPRFEKLAANLEEEDRTKWIRMSPRLVVLQSLNKLAYEDSEFITSYDGLETLLDEEFHGRVESQLTVDGQFRSPFHFYKKELSRLGAIFGTERRVDNFIFEEGFTSTEIARHNAIRLKLQGSKTGKFFEFDDRVNSGKLHPYLRLRLPFYRRNFRIRSRPIRTMHDVTAQRKEEEAEARKESDSRDKFSAKAVAPKKVRRVRPAHFGGKLSYLNVKKLTGREWRVFKDYQLRTFRSFRLTLAHEVFMGIDFHHLDRFLGCRRAGRRTFAERFSIYWRKQEFARSPVQRSLLELKKYFDVQGVAPFEKKLAALRNFFSNFSRMSKWVLHAFRFFTGLGDRFDETKTGSRNRVFALMYKFMDRVRRRLTVYKAVFQLFETQFRYYERGGVQGTFFSTSGRTPSYEYISKGGRKIEEPVPYDTAMPHNSFWDPVPLGGWENFLLYDFYRKFSDDLISLDHFISKEVMKDWHSARFNSAEFKFIKMRIAIEEIKKEEKLLRDDADIIDLRGHYPQHLWREEGDHVSAEFYAFFDPRSSIRRLVQPIFSPPIYGVADILIPEFELSYGRLHQLAKRFYRNRLKRFRRGGLGALRYFTSLRRISRLWWYHQRLETVKA